MKEGEIYQFRVRAQRSKHYFRVFVFEKRRDMYTFNRAYIEGAMEVQDAQEAIIKKRRNTGHLKKYSTKDADENFAAKVIPYEARDIKTWKLKNDIGIILFCKQRLGAGVVSHEMLHAALWYDRLINKNKKAEYGEGRNNRAEERLCYCLTHFVRKFYCKCIDLKLIGAT